MAGLRRVGLFGGTFDPPHVGHFILAAEAQHQLSLDKMLWVLTPNPPHKLNREITPLAQRLEMLQAALADSPDFELSRLDIDRPPPQYAVDTVRLCRLLHPQAQVFYLMGGDSLRDLPTWHQAQGLVTSLDGLGVLCRPGSVPDLGVLESLLPGLQPKVHFINAPQIDISASDIRNRARQSRPYRYFLPAPVYEYVAQSGLYRD